MSFVLDWLPKPVAASLRGQPPEVLMLVGGLVLLAIVLGFHMSMRR